MVHFSTPLSLYSIPVAWFVALYPTSLKVFLARSTTGYDNLEPRRTVASLADKKNDPAVVAKAARMEAAHMNGNEAFPLWVAGVLAANFAGVDQRALNVLSLLYIILRNLYNFIYIYQSKPYHATVRTVVWALSVAVPMYLLFAAAVKLEHQGHP
ncbi:hypothetical protein BDN72DRAFT_839383 [Pluteus cervinus]|uniref:Uncharacterized protein n=1 Tax=Pluteus cervinus TaxID=181527 RepID=A0ACD3AY12_9AGAR|nr:hypothetical protein BDN72DRAFT_839383 [Pluteus cervinus]